MEIKQRHYVIDFKNRPVRAVALERIVSLPNFEQMLKSTEQENQITPKIGELGKRLRFSHKPNNEKIIFQLPK